MMGMWMSVPFERKQIDTYSVLNNKYIVVLKDLCVVAIFIQFIFPKMADRLIGSNVLSHGSKIAGNFQNRASLLGQLGTYLRNDDPIAAGYLVVFVADPWHHGWWWVLSQRLLDNFVQVRKTQDAPVLQHFLVRRLLVQLLLFEGLVYLSLEGIVQNSMGIWGWSFVLDCLIDLKDI